MRNAVLLRPLTRPERALLVLLFLGFVAFGVLVEKRSAFLSRRMGDVGVYLRAGWSVRAGGQGLYHLTDDNGWHYSYPPLYAVLFVPLADPPERGRALAVAGGIGLLGSPGGGGPLLGAASLGANLTALDPDVSGGLPFAWSVAVVYVVNLLCLALAVHLLAGALERASRHPEVRATPVGCRRWWLLRLLPVLVCLPPIGHTLMRGQANLVVLLMVCGMAAALTRGRRLRAGLWLAGAVCVKIFPAYLLLVPLARRDGRCLAGCALGLAVGLGALPALALGPARTAACYRELAEVLVRPALNVGSDESRAKELIEVTATDNQSFVAAMHTALHPDRGSRPADASPGVRRAHWLVAAALTGLTLLAGWRRAEGVGPALFVGALAVLMVPCGPVSHLHYFVLAVPLVMALIAASWEQDRVTPLSWGLVALLGVQVVGQMLPLLPGCGALKDGGLAMYTALALWLAGCLVLARRPAAARAPAAVGAGAGGVRESPASYSPLPRFGGEGEATSVRSSPSRQGTNTFV